MYIYARIHGISLAKYGNESGVANPIHKRYMRIQTYPVTSPKLEGEIEKHAQVRISRNKSLAIIALIFCLSVL